MLLVHRGKKNPSIWEVAWVWSPFFLAADQLLHRRVDKKMTEQWKGVENPGLQEVRRMHQMVIDTILESYPLHGLREYLESVACVRISDGEVPRPLHEEQKTTEQPGLGLVNPGVVMQVLPHQETEGEQKTIDPVLLQAPNANACKDSSLLEWGAHLLLADEKKAQKTFAEDTGKVIEADPLKGSST